MITCRLLPRHCLALQPLSALRFPASCLSSSSSEEDKNKLHLAKPTKKFSLHKAKKLSKSEMKAEKRDVEDLGKEMVSAVRGLAEVSKHRQTEVKSELLTRLRQSRVETRKQGGVGELFAGVKVDTTPQTDTAAQGTASGLFSSDQQRAEYDRASLSEHLGSVGSDLFSGEPLHLFEHVGREREGGGGRHSHTPLWDELEQRHLDLMVAQPPRNGWEEMIEWTRQGKLWHFPINNEQGMEEEAKHSFDEHVLLEPLLGDFPRRGPIHHFMELVVAGLAKNYHLSVEEKREHIAWFKEYFEKHKELFDNVEETKAGSDQKEKTLS